MEHLLGKKINKIGVTANRRYMYALVDNFQKYLFYEAIPGCGCAAECIFVDIINPEYVVGPEIKSISRTGDGAIFGYYIESAIGKGSLILKSSDTAHNEGKVRYIGSADQEAIDKFLSPNAFYPLNVFKDLVRSYNEEVND